MGSLIKLELRKIIRQKSYYWCFGVGAVLLALGAFLSGDIGFNSGAMSLGLTAITDSSFVTLLGIFIAVYGCDDYANHTIKNIYAKGYSRSKVYFAKYLVSLGFTLIAAIFYFGLALGLGAIINPDEAVDAGRLFGSLGLQILLIVAYHAVYFAITMVVTKIGGSVALNLVGPMLVVTILSLACSLLKFKINISEYWMNDQLLVLSSSAITGEVVLKSVLMAVLYTVIFMVGGFLINRRKEV